MSIKLKGNFLQRNADQLVRWALLILLTGIFTFILYPNLAIQHHVYKLGDVADRNVKATEDFVFEDKIATEAKQEEAAASVLTVYDYDKQLASKLMDRVNQAFAILNGVFTNAAAVSSRHSKSSSRRHHRALPSAEEKALSMKATFEAALGLKFTDADYALLVQQKFQKSIAVVINRILKEILDNGVVPDKELLLKEIDSGITLRSVPGGTESTVTSLRSFYGLDQAKTMVRIVGDPFLKNYQFNLRNLMVQMVQELIAPNITLDRARTEARRKAAEAAVKPILHQIKAGEMVLREGERVTPIQLMKLNAMQFKGRPHEVIVNAVGAALVLMCLLVITYHLFAGKLKKTLKINNKDLLFMAVVLTSLFILAKLSVAITNNLNQSGAFVVSEDTACFGIPIAAGSMVVCLFIGLDYALYFSMLAAVCVTMLFQNRFELFLYFFLNSTLAAYWIQGCRERKIFIRAGAKLGLLNVLLVTAIHLFRANLSILGLLWSWGFALMGGLFVGIISLGLAPLVEMVFGYKTDVTLLELANLDQPILKRLMLESPGTYHHSMVVGSLVEAAAAQIGANPLKARVCGYYHDIGKINKPLYFIENQMEVKNRHDKLAPSMSALILISHIKDGVEIAKTHRLGQDIIDVIRQHHGTSLITYFYDKARQLKGEDAVNIENFRYPGPNPQTREAGLVMLADVVEAASRTLENPTPARIQKLVQNLINRVFSDGQLGNCELTLRDLHEIAKCFNKILNGIHHHRIEYPDAAATSNGKGKNGSTDRQQAKSDRHGAGSPSDNSDPHLKRLGLS